MTTHDEQATRTQPDEQATRTQAPEEQSAPPPVSDGPSLAQDERLIEEQPQETDVPPAAGAEPSADELLFADDNLSVLRSRWDDVQTAFVDDPTKCVQEADALVAEVVDQLAAGFADARSRLEAQWARGEDVSTEDLRIALRRYREFFQRLLAV